MKHLKRISELYKSTYRSAADQLKSKHPKRAEKIMSWAEEKGKSELSKEDVERIYPHPFVFSGNKDAKSRHAFGEGRWEEKLMGKFYIIDIEIGGPYRAGYFGVKVYLMNDWGQRISLEVSWGEGDHVGLKLGEPGFSSYDFHFLFDRRQDARHLVRFINEWYEDEKPRIKKPELRINKLYYTE
jgi:hypothetical protein